MPLIPLEDNFVDIVGKAQRGHRLSNAELAAAADISPAELTEIKAGKIREPALCKLCVTLKLNVSALLALARRQWYPKQPLFPCGFAMFNTAFEDMHVNSYLIWDSKTRLAAAFDTGATARSMLDTVVAKKLSLRYLFLTHTHDDHIAGLKDLAETNVEIWVGKHEPIDFLSANVFKGETHFHVGELTIKTLSTWGHSPGQTTFFITGLAWPLAIVGDSLFAGSMGGSSTHYYDQWRNNREKIFKLPNSTVLAPGHGPLTTLKQEQQHNPFFAE